MFERRIPEWLRHAPVPSLKGFAVLAAAESVARGVLVSVFPLAMYQALDDAQVVSQAYFIIGILSLLAGLLVPWLNRIIPRRWLYSTAAATFVVGALFGASGGTGVVIALVLISVATVSLFVCFNAYVLDYVARVELGRCETLRMFYSALGWTLGPVVGVGLMEWWAPAPFIVAALAALIMLGVFLFMRLGNGKLITRAKRTTANPMRYLGRFFRQPRLVAGWLFAVVRSCGWWIYVVYVPIFAVERGLDPQTGGIMLSVTNGMLFLTPFMLRWMQRNSVRMAVRSGFLASGVLFLSGWMIESQPVVVLALLFAGSVFLVLLDISGGLPFLMAVKPSERTEMSAVYSSYRDVSGILTPGAAWMVLLIAPLSGVFAVGGAALLGCWALAGRLHPRLGARRMAPAPAEQ
ncbi:MFS transporter [Roseovarius phycicola]|uniref:MFS transporter n=1 Tax=Roseovarius phycicola TaxID=3080976 RepID=A0ABZ2HCT2_9RHOB